MIYLLDLVPEILIHIVRGLKSEQLLEPDHDLYTLARTCRTLFGIVEPFLYDKFIQEDEPQVAKFLRTVLENPLYAARVKTIYLEHTDQDKMGPGDEEDDYVGDKDAGKNEDADDNENEDKAGARELKSGDHGDSTAHRDGDDQDWAMLVIKKADTLGIPLPSWFTRDEWITGLTKEKQAAISAMLLLSLPNLEVFHIKADSNVLASGWFIPPVIGIGDFRKPLQVLTNLKEVRYDYANGERIEIDLVKRLFYLPSIRKVEVLGAYEYRLGMHGPFPASCDIEDFEVGQGGIDINDWDSLLKPLKKLKRFTCRPGYPTDAILVRMVPSDLGAHLYLIKNTIEALHLSEYPILYASPDFLGSLQDFPRLRSVIIQPSILIGGEEFKAQKSLWELLPSTLEKLKLLTGGRYTSRNRSDLLDQVVEVVLRKEACFSGLKELILELGSWVPGQGLEGLWEACLTVGVRFQAFSTIGVPYPIRPTDQTHLCQTLF